MPKYVFNPFTAKLDIQASTKSDVGLSNVDNVQQMPLSYLDTDGTLSANSDTKVASQKATKTYADQLISTANALVYKGVIDCSANPNYPASDAGHLYIVSVAGKIGGASGVNVEVGDMIICNTDGTPSGNQATVGANFNIIEKNIEGAVSGPASAVTNNVAFFDGTTGKIIKDSGLTLSGTNTGDISITDSSTIDFTLTGQALSGSVIQSGITHNNLGGLTTGDPHTQYALLAGRSGGQTLIGGTANNNVLTLQGNSGTANTATNKAISLLVGNSGATEAVTVLNNGNVGIGTASPQYKLDVAGSVAIDSPSGYGARLNIGQPATNYPGNAGWAGSWNSNILLNGLNDTSISFQDSGARVDTMRVGGGVFHFGENVGWGVANSVFYGDVGIGTTTPNKKLHIYENNLGVGGFTVQNIASGQNAQTQNLLINDASYYAYYGITSTGFNGGNILDGGKAFFGSYLTDTVIFTQTTKDIIFATNFSEVARITSGGNVGIGTTTPATSGLLDLTSTTGALIVPRMTTTQRNALTAVNGMIIYNTTTNTMQGRINGAWTDM